MKPARLLLILLLAGGLLVWWTWPRRPHTLATLPVAAAPAQSGAAESRPLSAEAPVAGETAVKPTPYTVISGNPTTSTAPLPPAGADVAQNFDALAQRARNGDAKAALRLYHDLSTCERFAGAERGVQWLRQRMENPELSERRRARAERRLGQYTQISCLEQQMCGQLTPTQRRDPTQWLLQAAASGDADARIAFASGNFLSEGQLDALEYLPVYRAQALSMLEQGLAAGHPAALRLAAFAYGARDEERSRLPLAQLLPYDPVRAQTYREALTLALPPGARLGGRRGIPDQSAQLDPAQRAQASAAAREVYQRQLSQVGDLGAEMRRYRAATAQFDELPEPEDIAVMAPQCR